MVQIVDVGTELEQVPFKRDREAELRAMEQFDLFYQNLSTHHREVVTRARKQDEFYRGKQWDDKDLSKLEAEGRPALTLNKVLSTVNTFLGEQIARRASFRYRPYKDATHEQGHMMSNLAMAIADMNQYHWKESEMVEDGVIRDAGYLDIRMTFDKNIQGDVKMEVIHPDVVIPERPITSYDPADWQGVIVARWFSLDEIESRYGPEKAGLIQQYAMHMTPYSAESMAVTTDIGYDDSVDGMIAKLAANTEEERKRLKQIRVIDRQYYKSVMVYELVDTETLQTKELPPDTPKKKAELAAKAGGLHLREKTVRRLYWRVTADRVVLFEGWSPYRTPTIIPYYPYFRKGHFFGIVTNLISPQEQYNKVSSQELHIVNSTANGGWMVRRGSLANMTTEDLARDGSKTGIVIETTGDPSNVAKIQPNQIPNGISAIKMESANAIRDIAGFSDMFVGANANVISGVAMDSQIQRGQTQIMKPIDNLERTRYLVARKILELVGEFFTDARVLNVVDYSQPGLPTVELPINMPGEDGGIINAIDDGEYEVGIETIPAQNSYNDTHLAAVLNMRAAGINIPDYHAVMYTDLPQRQAIAEELKMLAGLQAPSEEEIARQQMMEEIAMQDMMVSMQEKEARAQELLSRMNLNEAKTQEIMTEDQREYMRLQHELQMARESYNLRIKLAELQAQSKSHTQTLKGTYDMAKLMNQTQNKGTTK